MRVPRLHEYYRIELMPFKLNRDTVHRPPDPMKDAVSWEVRFSTTREHHATGIYFRHGNPLYYARDDAYPPTLFALGRPSGTGFGKRDGQALLDIEGVIEDLWPERFKKRDRDRYDY